MDHRGSSDLVLEILEELKKEVKNMQADMLSGWMKRAVLVRIQSKIDQFKPKA